MRSTLALIFLIALAVATSPAMAEKEWTFAVFLNADNNLDGFGVKDVEEMSRVGSNDLVDVVVQFDRQSLPARRLHLSTGADATVEELGEVDMGDPNELVRFFAWTKERYPAKRYALVIWNHGSGWEKGVQQPLTRGISYDDSSGHGITTAQLGEAMEQVKGLLGRKLDLLAMDACLMQMAEVLYELRDRVDYVAASEEGVPGDGYPYDAILRSIGPGTDPETLGKTMVAEFLAWYRPLFDGQNKRATQSFVRTEGLDALYAALEVFAQLVLAGGHAPVIKDSLPLAVKFLNFGRTNVDIGQFMRLIQERTGDQPLREACQGVLDALRPLVLAEGSAGEESLRACEGMAIYFPHKPETMSPAFGALPFCRQYSWNRMLRAYFKQTGWPWGVK